MENAQPDTVDPPCALDTDPVQALSEDLLAKSSRKKRLLSERQKEALRKGRAIRWSKKATDHNNEETPASFETEQQQDPLSGIPTDSSMDPHMKALLDPNTSSSESESESSSDDDDHKKKRKAKKLKKSIPKAVRRRLDKYLRMKLEESRRDVPLDTCEEYDNPLPPHNPVLARTPRYTAPINFL